jgi:hypothetical protein
MKRRLRAHWQDTTDADRIAGIGWYDRALAASAQITPDDPARAAGIIAALSPRCLWATNVRWARDVVSAHDSGALVPPPVHTTKMRPIAWRIAQGTAPLEALNGPKVRAFFENIMGNHRRVTVDVHAAYAAEGRRVKASPAGRRYANIERAYQEVADEVGISPRDFQAAIWVHVRGAAD